MSFERYHAHLYYDESNMEEAQQLAQKAHYLFKVSVGSFHKKPIGPHPSPSCQLSVSQEVFADIIPWLMKNRGSVHVFVHADTGDDYLDHTVHTLWLGSSYELDLAMFRKTNKN